MAASDQTHWDDRYRATLNGPRTPSIPERYAAFADAFAAAGTALEIACGTGAAAVWLAKQGVHTRAYDISPVAIETANQLAAKHDVRDRCHFAVHDFDDGLPDGEQVGLVVCTMFRDPALDQAIVQRLRPGGLLATAALSEVGAAPGRFRVAAGALPAAFASLELLESGEADGVAWLVARKH